MYTVKFKKDDLGEGESTSTSEETIILKGQYVTRILEEAIGLNILSKDQPV